MMKAIQWTHHVISLAYMFFSWLLLSTDRTDFSQILILYSILFGVYLVIIHFQKATFNYMLNVVILTQLGALLFMPQLSNDMYRFLWDGAVTWMGENPMNSKPDGLMTDAAFNTSPYLKELYRNMSDLSKRNYTCYPTVNQFYFTAANTYSNSVWINNIVLKGLIAGTQIVGTIYFVKLLEHFSFKPYRVLILIMNPLWMIETVGNLHFEGVMFSFLIIAFYFLVKEKWLFGAIFIGLAIHVKLIPLVLLPFLFRYLGWKISAFVYLMVGLVVTSLALIYLNESNVFNFIESIALYFRAFEFNSFIFYHSLHYGYDYYGFYPVEKYALKLSRWSMFIITSLSVYGGFHDFKTMMKRMMFGLLIYILLSTTVHPWYILTLLGLSVFTNYSFGVVWSFLIFLSYAAYGPFSDPTIRNYVTLEYLVLFAALGIELIRRKPIIPAYSFQDSLDSRSGTGS